MARWSDSLHNDGGRDEPVTQAPEGTQATAQQCGGTLGESSRTCSSTPTTVAREASRQLGHLTREEVVPRVRTGYEGYVRPGVEQAKSTRAFAGDSAERTLGNALGSVLSIGDIANDARVRRALERVSPRAAAVVKEKQGPGVGTYLAIGAGIIAAAGVAYAVWQTFRADDELWVADDEPTPSTSASTAPTTPSSDRTLPKAPPVAGGAFVVPGCRELALFARDPAHPQCQH